MSNSVSKSDFEAAVESAVSGVVSPNKIQSMKDNLKKQVFNHKHKSIISNPCYSISYETVPMPADPWHLDVTVPKKNNIDNMLNKRLAEYEMQSNQLEVNVFESLRQLGPTKEIRDQLRLVADVELVELLEPVTMDKVTLGNYVNIDKVYNFQCTCTKKQGSIGTCDKPHLNDATQWIRLNHVTYIFVGTNE